MKSFRLFVHQKNFSEEDLLINQADLPIAKQGDILEIYHPQPEEQNPRLLLQIQNFKDDLQTKDTISVEQSIATAFCLRTYKDVCIRLVDPADVALDSIELTFKDQYMGRSEMWRLKTSLVNTCVYMNKKIEFCGGAVRCQVYEMWSQGDRVACGVITEDTKVVFRSSTSMVYLFLQMSSEMWDFDIYGDLYFEKAVNGFLADLFMKWKKHGSNHEVTIVLFSRTFYEASSLEEFPLHMRECLQKDYRGRYYEDFYRVAVQNERYDDWCCILVQLRRIFSEYLKLVLEYHSRSGLTIPKATNSTAAQGNFLEVLNMSLNVFEKHYLDRSFDRTGQLSVVITPGVGVFEVDRELTNITKQRIIDNGVGSDLVCVGEQPLHAVPLLKFHNKDAHLNIPDDYSMPHWINLSFYSTNKKIAYSNFVPRIKIPPSLTTSDKKQPISRDLVLEEDYIHNTFFDYDAYDAQVFALPNVHSVHEPGSSKQRRNYSMSESRGDKRKMSDPDILHYGETSGRTQPITIPSANCSPIISPHAEDRELSPPVRMVIGSEGSPPLESRALINPFDPSHVTIKLTSNRRRWTHIFPKGPTGVLIQQHHYQAVPAQSNLQTAETNDTQVAEKNGQGLCLSKSAMAALQEYCKKCTGNQPTTNSHRSSSHPKNASKSSTLLWGATGEQEWTPALTTGVDWKSLTIPACLPITTDYFPDRRALQIDYVVSLYSLLPDSVNADWAQKSAYKKPLTTSEVFKELISQRLAQGFQLILMPQTRDAADQRGKSVVSSRNAETETIECYHLSIGRLFHKISLAGNTISVTRYRPRHPYPGFNYQYRYRFYAPYHESYEESYATFTTEKLEHYNWNYLDHYVCTGGDTDFVLVDAMKYWRFRVYLLPLNNASTKRITEGARHCDIFTHQTVADHQQTTEGLLKFIEAVINKIKRPNMSKKPRNVSCNSPFRERLGSNRLPERPMRPRSGSKVMERGRASPAVETTQQTSNDLENNTEDIEPQLQATATSSEIIEAMKHPTTGLIFLTTQQNLPPQTFISADAIHWLVTHMENITNEKAVHIFESLLREQYIRHASGDVSKPFVYGFYLYYIIPNEKDEKDSYQSLGDFQKFENDWLEVEIRPALNWGLPLLGKTPSEREQGVPHFLCDDIDSMYHQADFDTDSPLYKRMHLETDTGQKSDRVEWGHAKYMTVFRPDQAYELVVEWLTSSGSIIAELLSGWARKAQAYGLQMIPIPHDPLALPYSNKSDPLRGPIFVPLNIKCLEKKDRLFKEFREDTSLGRLFLLQEAIVARFGFIPCLVEPQSTGATTPEHQYIHSTGTVFILISSPGLLVQNRQSVMDRTRPAGRYSVHADVVPSPHEEYITRHVSGKNKDDYDNSRKMGFMWCWNHMISKRWRTNQAVDTNFQVRLLKDFREFCANVEDRLWNFWEESWESKEAASRQVKTAFL